MWMRKDNVTNRNKYYRFNKSSALKSICEIRIDISWIIFSLYRCLRTGAVWTSSTADWGTKRRWTEPLPHHHPAFRKNSISCPLGKTQTLKDKEIYLRIWQKDSERRSVLFAWIRHHGQNFSSVSTFLSSHLLVHSLPCSSR